jgi:hypothetical protein
MTIDIDNMTETALMELNQRVVARLRFMRLVKAQAAMMQLRIGQQVSFQPEGRDRVFGVVTRYNKKSVTVITSGGARWNVAPSLLHPEPLDAKATIIGADFALLPREI